MSEHTLTAPVANETSANGATEQECAKYPPLEPGDHLDQKTFHERYEAMPEDARAELIGGIVFLPSPLNGPHSRAHVHLTHWLFTYERSTPGTETHDNATNLLDDESEPQPDACLLITAPTAAQTSDQDQYIAGPPELIAEVASSSQAIDLHRKRADYERAGVKEYLVVVLNEARVVWWVSRNGAFEELSPGPDGILRSEVFPGLWLDPAALLRLDADRLDEVLRQGLASPEHAAFVARLARPSALEARN
jgi:Uma2 family endonuclease